MQENADRPSCLKTKVPLIFYINSFKTNKSRKILEVLPANIYFLSLSGITLKYWMKKQLNQKIYVVTNQILAEMIEFGTREMKKTNKRIYFFKGWNHFQFSTLLQYRQSKKLMLLLFYDNQFRVVLFQLYYIQFLSKELQKNSQNYMNLRHQKPINSYRGLANNDKNEFNDDDFKHQPSPAKKFASNSGEQMHKYSKILAKFIMNSNQFYRSTSQGKGREKSEVECQEKEVKMMQDENRNFKTPKKQEQPKQKRKIMPKIQIDKLQQKQQKQKQIYKTQFQTKSKKELQQPPPEKLVPNPINGKNSSVNTETTNQPIGPVARQNKANKPPENIVPMFGQNLPMNSYPNPAMFGNISAQQYMLYMDQMMRSAISQQMQMKGINMGNINNLSGINVGNLNNMGIPNGMNPQYMMNMMANSQLMRQNAYENYMRSNAMQSQALIKQTPSPIYNLNQVYLGRKQSVFNFSTEKPNLMAKRANFHVGLAYHIHLNQRNRKGLEQTNIEQIDPTRQSRLIKQKQQGLKRNSRTKIKK